MKISDWKKQLEEERSEKDWFFTKDWQSPIPPQERSRLKGLDYFPPDPNYRFEIGDKKLTPQAYKRTSIEETLFVPFRDATSGKETYSAGRYLDLDPEIAQTPDGKWILDFSRAYNPWCVYSEMYTCPFVLPENWLEVLIRAGEKDYPLSKHD